MIYYKTTAEVELMRESALLVSKTISEIAGVLKPGMTTLEVDALAEQFILDHKATPSFKNYKGYIIKSFIKGNLNKRIQYISILIYSSGYNYCYLV